MKKIIALMSAGILFTTVSLAQDLVSKKGEPYLPQAGDWAIGVDVTPFFDYIGNLANGSQDNPSPGFEYAYPLQVFGKWFRQDDLAWRGRIRFIGINNYTEAGFVQDDLADPAVDPFSQVEDEKQVSRMNTTLAFGIEKRKGSTRLQGFWGGEAVLSFSSGKDTYKYGNQITGTNQFPSTYVFDAVNTNPPNGYRATEVNYGTGFSLGVRPFIGAEYFIFPKVSFGGEFGYSLGFTTVGSSTITSEYYDAGVAGTLKNTQDYGSYIKSGFIMDNDNVSGSIRLMLHF